MPVGVVLPRAVVVSIERRHGTLVGVTQLPAGAAMPTSGPRLLKPTLVPALRRPATAMTPGTNVLQLAGEPTAPLALPAETTTSAPRLVTDFSAISKAGLQLPVPPRLRLMMSAGKGLLGTGVAEVETDSPAAHSTPAMMSES